MQKFLHFWGVLFFMTISLHAQQPFEINTAASPDLNPESIVEDLCFGPGIEVIDVGFAGVDESVGVFYGAQNFVGIDSGFLMTTGLSVSTLGGLQTGADRPSNFVASVNNSSAAFYPGLNNLANSNIIKCIFSSNYWLIITENYRCLLYNDNPCICANVILFCN